MPSGNGGTSGVPRTRWFATTGIGASRPGSASSGDGRADGLRVKRLMTSDDTRGVITDR